MAVVSKLGFCGCQGANVIANKSETAVATATLWHTPGGKHHLTSQRTVPMPGRIICFAALSSAAQWLMRAAIYPS